MNLLTIERDLIARLKSQITGCDILSFPQTPERYFRNLREKASILVRYDASDYEPPIVNKNETRVQKRTARWIIGICHRNLIRANDAAGTDGVYVRLQQVRQALTGYTPGTTNSVPINDSTVMYPIRDGYDDHVGDLWFYSITFEHELEELPSR